MRRERGFNIPSDSVKTVSVASPRGFAGGDTTAQYAIPGIKNRGVCVEKLRRGVCREVEERER